MSSSVSRDFVAATRTLTIGGKSVAGEGPPIEVFNPATAGSLAVVPAAAVHQVDAAVDAARAAFPHWAGLAPAERSRMMHRLADVLDRHRDELTATIVNEVGTPIALAQTMQVGLAIEHLRWFADAALRDRTEHLPPQLDPWVSVSQISYRPVGVVGAITAYNYPLLIAVWKLGAALAAGCTAVLMPSPRTPLTTLWLGELAREADLPAGVVNVIVGEAEIGQRLVTHPGTDKISFTGSVAVGSSILSQLAPSVTGAVLELGGKSANIVFDGVDFDAIAPDIHKRWARNAGQGCASPNRLIVPEHRYDEFAEASVRAFAEVKVGVPWEPDTIVGPVIRPEHRARVQAYVDGALDEGGRVIAGSSTPPERDGWYVSPVLLGGLDQQARAVQEEIFGPVAILHPYKDEQDAIRLANGTPYGLSAAVYTPTVAHGLEVAAALRAGTVWINGGGQLRADAVFGGFGVSGLGREQGENGIREFLEPQHVQWRAGVG